MADAVTRALRAEPGSVLAFLPGAAEIRRTETLLRERVDAATDVVALYGALDADDAGPRDRARAGRAAARWCSPRRSPRPRSPSRACASWSIAASRACRATSRTSG